MVAPKKADIQILLDIDNKTWIKIRSAAKWIFDELEGHVNCTASQGWTYVDPNVQKEAYEKVIFSLSIGS